MADNTVEVVLRANVSQFQQAIQQGTATLKAEFAQAAQETRTQSERIREASERIGVRPFGDIEQEIRELERSYRTLARSGELSSRALTQAHVRMQEGIRELRAQQNGWVQSLQRAQGEIIALGAAMYGLVRVLSISNQEYRRFEDAVASVNSILDVSPERIAELSGEVRALAQDMGVDATRAAQALYEIISSGVSEQNALTVLEQSARAAIAGLTDTQTAARVGLSVINSYGLKISQLGRVYDVLFQTVEDGVTTLPELAASLGQVLPVAAGTGIAFETVAAALAQLTKAGLNTPQAITALRGAIVNLTTPTPEAAKAFDELGISVGDFLSTLREIGALNLDPQTLRRIAPDVEARNAVLALTGDLEGLSEALEGTASAAGATDAAYQDLADGSAQEAREYAAALTELRLQIGEAVAAFTPLLRLITDLITGFNNLPTPVKQGIAALAGLAGTALLVNTALGPIAGSLRLLFKNFGDFAERVEKVIPGIRTLGGLLRVLGAGGAIGFTASIFYDRISGWFAYQEALEQAAEAQRKFIANEEAIQAVTRGAADTQIRSTDELRDLTRRELRLYRERLAQAQAYYESVRDLRARAYAAGGNMGIEPEALAAAKRAGDYREAAEAIEAQLAEREARAQAHAARLTAIKDEELQAIRLRLAEQIEAFEGANKRIDEARKQREEIAQAFRELERDLLAGPQTPDNELNVLDLQRQARELQAALDAGNPEEAIRRAERAREIITALNEQGAASRQYLVGQTRRIAELADQAAAANQAQAQEQADAVRGEIEDLVARAEFLRRIQIGFDFASAEQSAEALRRRLSELLAQNPVIVPVKLAQDGPGQQALRQSDELLGIPAKAAGGPIVGPGTGTSDDVLMWGSNGEYVIRQAAVARYGRGLLDAINQMRLPGYARGGLIERVSIPSMASAPAPATASAGGRALTLQLDGQRFDASIAGAEGERLERWLAREALKRGRR